MRRREPVLHVALLLAVLLACGKKAPGERSQPAPAPEVAAPASDEIPIDVEIGPYLEEYRSNVLRAEARFTGHRVRVSGVVQAIGKGQRGEGYISLGAAGAGTFDRSGVHCTLADPSDPYAMPANVGGKIVVVGTDGGHLDYGVVSLRACRLNPVAHLCSRLRDVLDPTAVCQDDKERGDVGVILFDLTGANRNDGSLGVFECFGASAKRNLGAKENYARGMGELRRLFPYATLIGSDHVQCVGVFYDFRKGKEGPFTSDRKAAITAFFEAL